MPSLWHGHRDEIAVGVKPVAVGATAAVIGGIPEREAIFDTWAITFVHFFGRVLQDSGTRVF